MRVNEILCEAKVSIRDQILADVKKHGAGEYFVRFTGVDRVGFSSRQFFGRTPDVDDPRFDVDYIGQKQGRPALWFYPLKEYLRGTPGLYGSEYPYVWLVKLKPTAWLQTVGRNTKQIQPAPEGKKRVGIMRLSSPPAAIFFEPGFEVVGRYYDYASRHQPHGRVKGPSAAPRPSFFDRVRGYTESK